MRRFLLLALAVGVATAALAAPAMAAGDSLGPPAGTIYAFDQVYRTVSTPTSLPDNGPFDTIYVFPDCSSCASTPRGGFPPRWWLTDRPCGTVRGWCRFG
jgi:hypothetical protein